MREGLTMRSKAIVLAYCLFSAPAFADAIDGDWCKRDGSHVRIDGPQIEIAPGTRVMGKYERHAFSYVAPFGDAEARAEIFFRLRSETEMRRVRDPAAMPEHDDLWQRCETISLNLGRQTLLRRPRLSPGKTSHIGAARGKPPVYQATSSPRTAPLFFTSTLTVAVCPTATLGAATLRFE